MILLALLLQTTTPPRQEPEPEIRVLAPSKPFAQTPATMVVEPVGMLVATLDADGDGRTSRAEMEAGVQRTFDAIDTARAGRLRYLAFADWAERWLGDRNALPSPFDVDRDADGAVTPTELQSHFSRLFSRFDRNRDGAISRAETLTIRTTAATANGPVPVPPPERPRPRRRR